MLEAVIKEAKEVLAEAARNAAEAAGNAEEVQPEPRSAPEDHVTDKELAHWLPSVIEWEGQDDMLQVLRDELATTHHVDALQHPVEESGTWAPDDCVNNKRSSELMGEMRRDLLEAFPGQADFHCFSIDFQCSIDFHRFASIVMDCHRCGTLKMTPGSRRSNSNSTF